MLFALLQGNNSLQAQSSCTVARNTIYAEAASWGPAYSLNFDRMAHRREAGSSSWRAGLSLYRQTVALPLGWQFFTGQGAHHAELSFTVIPVIRDANRLFAAGNESDKQLYVVPAIGYRLQPVSGGFFLRATVAPALFLDPPSDNFWKMQGRWQAGASIGAGYSF
ncbi:MAG TPA: hypothetical protein PKE63_12335 [Lacibacter sp.]|nr:hypothetical protein [Lacibacter sp.]HMO90331.1 hypothetical protein [Lacibacter sp.]HMP88058.1 hypothetical protein [Lacibacter sp.]